MVKARLYECVQRSPRGYRLETQKERVLVVNHLIRLPVPVKFEPSPPIRKTPRLAAASETDLDTDQGTVRLLGEKAFYAIERSMRQV